MLSFRKDSSYEALFRALSISEILKLSPTSKDKTLIHLTSSNSYH